MAELITLADFNLDTTRLESSLKTLQDAYFDLKKKQKEYTDQNKEAQKQIEKLRKDQELLSNSTEDNSEAMASNQSEIDRLINTQRELFRSEQNIATQMAATRQEIGRTNSQLITYNNTEGKTTSLIDLGNEALARQINNKNDARAANIALNRIVNQLNPNIEEEAAAIVRLNAQMDANTEFIRENSSEAAKQKMNIGNYSSALEGLDSILSQFGIDGQQARTVVSGFTSTISDAGSDIANYTNQLVQSTRATLGFRTSSQLSAESQQVQALVTEEQTVANTALAVSTEGVTVATAATTIGLKGFAIALASTGIGLIVIGLAALFSYLKDLDPLLDKIEQGFAGISAVVRTLGSAIANLSFDGLGESMSNAAKEAIALKEAQQDLADLQNSQEVANAKASQQYDELILKSKNRTLTEKERINFLQQAEKIENDNYKQRTNLANAEIANAIKNAKIKGQLSDEEIKKLQRNTLAYGTYLLNAGKITEDDLDNLKKAELGKIAIDAESTKRLEKNQNAQDKLFEDAKNKREKDLADSKTASDKKIADKQKEVDKLIEKSKQEIDLFVAQQGFKKKSSEEEYNLNKALFDKEITDLQLRYKKGVINKTEFETEKLNITNNFLSKNVQLTIDNAQLELDAQSEKNNKILENDNFLSQEQLAIKKQALANQLKADNDFALLQLQNGVINQQQYDAAINKTKEENVIANYELENQRKAAKQEAELLDIENKKVADQDNFIALAELEKQKNDILKQQEIDNAENTGANILDINNKYAELNKQIEEAKNNNKVKLASQAFGNLASIFGEESAAGKAAAIAQTTIDTYQSAISSYSSLSGIPIVGPVLGGIAAGAAIVTGLKAVQKITSTPEPTINKTPSYASGIIGLRGIGSGTSDNIKANLSVGESVINAKSTSMFANELSEINKAGGGVGLNGGSNILNQNQIQSKADSSQLANTIANAVAIGAMKGTSEGSQKGLVSLADNRKVMQDAKF